MRNSSPSAIRLGYEKFGDEFLDETIAVWQPYSENRKLTRADAREIASSCVGAFELLLKWARAEDAAITTPREDGCDPTAGR